MLNAEKKLYQNLGFVSLQTMHDGEYLCSKKDDWLYNVGPPQEGYTISIVSLILFYYNAEEGVGKSLTNDRRFFENHYNQSNAFH